VPSHDDDHPTSPPPASGPARLIAAAVLALAGALALTPAARAAEHPTSSPSGAVRLSDEVMLTRWANATQRASVFSRPSTKAHKVGNLRLLTEDGFAEVYLLLSRWTDDGRHRLGARPDARPPERPEGLGPARGAR
jgi:hypothetical protein